MVKGVTSAVCVVTRLQNTDTRITVLMILVQLLCLLKKFSTNV